MATSQPSNTSPGVFLLPLTGRRNRKRCVVAYATVLDDDFTRESLALHFWNLHPKGYVVRSIREHDRKVVVRLHQVVFRNYHGPIPDGKEVDHIDRDPLNNLPDNLRALTRSGNVANRGKPRNNTSGFVGVRWHKDNRNWVASINPKGRYKHLGSFPTAEEAARAVNLAYADFFPHVPPPNVI